MDSQLSKALAPVLGVICFDAIASAQSVTATIRVLPDHPTGIVEPGEVLSFRVVAARQPQVQCAVVRFDGVATDHLNQAGNVHQYAAFGPLHVLGQVFGGSVLGTEMAIVPNFFTASPQPASFQNWGLDLARFDRIAPSPGASTTVDPDLVREPIRPNARSCPFLNSPAWVEVDTTWIGARVRVLPPPGSPLAATLGMAFAFGRGPRR